MKSTVYAYDRGDLRPSCGERSLGVVACGVSTAVGGCTYRSEEVDIAAGASGGYALGLGFLSKFVMGAGLGAATTVDMVPEGRRQGESIEIAVLALSWDFAATMSYRPDPDVLSSAGGKAEEADNIRTGALSGL